MAYRCVCFFVLSGFLICYRYYDDCTFSAEWMKRYLKNRIARIYPIYLLLTVCTFIVFSYQGNDDNSLFILFSNLFFFRGFSDSLKFTGIAQGWSLTVEETFYFSAPLIFLLAKKYKLLFIQPLLWLLSGGLLVLLIGQLGKFPFMENYPFMLGYTFFGRSTEFFAGIALALYLKKRMWNSTSSTKKSLATYTGLSGIVLTLCLLTYIAILAHVRLSLRSYTGLMVNNIILPASIVVFFYGLVTEKSLVQKILATAFVQLLGRSSYVFYLVHMGFIQRFLSGYVVGTGPVGLGMLFILLWIVSVLIFRFVEEPVNLAIRNSGFLTPPVKLPNKI